MKKVIKKMTQAISHIDLADLFMVLGAGLAFYGVFLIYRPASFLLLGAGLIYTSIKLERDK